MKELKRASGILLHPTSLPGAFGIGDLGPEAFAFADFLADTGQTLWQMLPLGPTGYENSPYMSFSAFAGNWWLISLEKLVKEGLLEKSDIQNPPVFPRKRVNYTLAMKTKKPLLLKSYERFNKKRLSGGLKDDFFTFSQRHAVWLDDYALFMALKEENRGNMWSQWEEGLSKRNPESLVEVRNRLKKSMHLHKYLQYIFFRQWEALKKYCNQKGIRVIGDIPVYVAYDSAEVWANRELFHLNENGQPVVVAGVPPDYFSATGQRWGNPIYRWDEMARSGYAWWKERFSINFSLFDILRIDHFRGFESYWEIPADEHEATNGRWVKGPGVSLFHAVQESLGELDVIAEDLGVITPEVDALRDAFAFPGMRILQMAFGNDPKADEYIPHNHIRNCAVYTGTHDHNTTSGWFHSKPGTHTTISKREVEQERKYVIEYLGTDGSEIHWDFIRLAMSSVAHMSIYPLQDVLGLGIDSRMNLPGTVRGNWEWRFSDGMLTQSIRQKLRDFTRIYGRAPE